MAFFEGNYEIYFNLDDFSDERRELFLSFMNHWRQNHPLEYEDWINNFDYDKYESVLWGGNDPENIEDLHNFLIEAAKDFPEFEAEGNGDGEDVYSGSWSKNYKFSLQSGNLEWEEDEYDENSYKEQFMKELSEELAGKPIPKDFKRNLRELLPDLNESLPNGLIIEDGVLQEDIDFNAYYKFLGVKPGSCFYFPPEVEEIDEIMYVFSEYGETIDTLIITTNLKTIPHYGFNVLGFENFYIIDADTKETVFYTNRFLLPEDTSAGLDELDLFVDFVDDYEKDLNNAICNEKYGIAVDSFLTSH